MPKNLNINRVLRPNEQAAMLGVSRCTIHRLEKADPTFPKKIQIGVQAVGRMESELVAWIESKKEA